MKIALYIGNFCFPDCNAAGKRVYANGKILKELGYKVVFVGVNKSIESISSLKKQKKFMTILYIIISTILPKIVNG